MTLFTPFRLGSSELSSRVVMAPMTRSRAIGNVPNDLMRDYYAQRAGAGLIVTEGTAPSADALGYARIPGLFSDDQVVGWRRITEAVHAERGVIFAQLMHVGRIAHPLNLPEGARVVAPSAVRADGGMYTDQEGMQPMPEPHALTSDELPLVLEEFVHAARNAIAAGFDGVELHGANGYLLHQFLSAHTNRREDGYGGSVAGRSRFVVEVAEKVAAAIGSERVGLRLSPHATFNDMKPFDEEAAQFEHVARRLQPLGLAYLHFVLGAEGAAETARVAGKAFGGTVILNGGFDRDRAEAALAEGDADLISFGRPFIANPDLVVRMKQNLALADADADRFYTPGPEGYVDYPPAAA